MERSHSYPLNWTTLELKYDALKQQGTGGPSELDYTRIEILTANNCLFTNVNSELNYTRIEI